MTIQLLDDQSSDARLKKIRHDLVDGLWKGAFIIALTGAPLSILRFVSTGWLSIYTFHALLAAFVLAIYFNLKRIPYSFKALMIVILFFAVGFLGMLVFGLLGAGSWWLVVNSFIISTLYSIRMGIIHAIMTIIIILAVGILFTENILVYQVDVEKYVTSLSSWVSFLTAAIVMPVVILQAIAIFQRSTKELLDEVEEQHLLIKKMATHDQLTGLLLLNAASEAIEKAIYRASRSNKKTALFFIDLDGFKKVNDTFGHDAGDSVLVEVARRLEILKREQDSAARIGGDEFLLIVENVEDENNVSNIARRILKTIAEPVAYLDEKLSVGASIGIAIYPEHANDEKSLRKMADSAMYKVKKMGRNNFLIAE